MSNPPKSHTGKSSIHALRYCSECSSYPEKILVKKFIEQNPGITRDSLRTLIKDRKVLVHRFKNRFYVCWK